MKQSTTSSILRPVQSASTRTIQDLASALIRFLVLGLISFGAASADAESDSNTAYYAGDMSVEKNRGFFERLGGKTVERLVVTSYGGEVAAGIELGHWIFENGIDVEVAEYCLSSCANYVFTAGRRKIIRPGAVVAWHGNYRHLLETGLWRDEVTLRMETYGETEPTARRRVLEQVEDLVRLEDAFFARIGVDGYLCWIGKMPPYEAPNYYFVSGEDMARFGVSDVTTPADYGQTDVSGFAASIVFIELVGPPTPDRPR